MNSALLHNTFDRVCRYLRSFDTITERFFVTNNKIMVTRSEYGHKLFGTRSSSNMNYPLFFGTISCVEDQLKCFLLGCKLEYPFRDQKIHVWKGSIMDDLWRFPHNIRQQLSNSIGHPASLEEWNIKLDLLGI